MKIEIIQYEPVHAYTILDRNVREENLWLSKYPDWEKWVKGWKDSGPAFTLIIDGEIVGCAGVILLDWRRGEAWSLLSTLLYKYKKITFRAIKNGLDKIVKEKKLRRVHSLVNPESELNKEFMKHLGFKNETPNGLKSFGPNGETLLMYGREYKWIQ